MSGCTDNNAESSALNFFQEFPEKEQFNQYWYSPETISALAQEVIENLPKSGGACAFLSTPSVYFRVKQHAASSVHCVLFDFDDKFSSENEHFVSFDFNRPDLLPKQFCHAFDFIVIDPPFITHEVWEKYTQATHFLLSENGKILLTTIKENEAMILELLGCRPQVFKPSIPHLVYQYALFINYSSKPLECLNPEIQSE